MMSCERCEKWFCLPCIGMTPAQYDLLNADLGELIHWYCTDCNENAVRAVKNDNEIEERCKSYMAKFRQDISQEIKDSSKDVEDRLTTKIDSLTTEVQAIKNLAQTAQGPENATGQQNTEELLEEMKDRERRKLNLILFNVKESDKESGEEKKADDLESVRDILSKVNINTPLSKPTRLGKGNAPRPLRITTASEEDKRKITKAASKLQNIAGYERCFINRDMTPTEQRAMKKLVEEKKTKQRESEQSGDRETTWVIRNGTVVKGRPRKAEPQEGD